MDTDAEDFKQTKVYTQLKRNGLVSIDGTFQTLDKALDALESYDKLHEEKSKYWDGIFGLGFLVILIAFGWGVIESQTLIESLIDHRPMIIMGIIGSGIAAFSGLMARRAQAEDIEDERYQTARTILKMVSRDIAFNQVLHLHLGLWKSTHGRNVTKVKPAIKKFAWRSTKYEDPWFRLSGRFLDGTKFWVAINEKIEIRERKKISQSGKRKTKYKSRADTEITVRLKIKQKHYPNFKSLNDDYALPTRTRLKKARTKGPRISLTCVREIPKRPGSHSGKLLKNNRLECFTVLLLGAYQPLNASGRVTT